MVRPVRSAESGSECDRRVIEDAVDRCALMDWLWEPRADWNRLGPWLPGWFRRRLNRINPNWVLQFIPHVSVDPQGTHTPGGLWVICTRLPRSRLLYRAWTMALMGRDGRYMEPNADVLALLRVAQDYANAGLYDHVSKVCDDHLAAMKDAATVAEKQEHLCRIEGMIRTYQRLVGNVDLRTHYSVPEMPGRN